MSIGWVAASVRAGAMARRRIGAAAALRVARSPDLAAALDLLAGTAYAPELAAVRDALGSATAEAAAGPELLAAAQRAVADALLWQIRVLAGWAPAAGRIPARALVAAFERENIVDHLRAMARPAAQPSGARPAGSRNAGSPGPAGRQSVPPQPVPYQRAADQRVPQQPVPYQLGTLRTAWDRVRTTRTPQELREELARSAWGDPGETDPARLRDVLTAIWLRRVAAAVPAAAGWARTGAALLIARIAAVEQQPLPPGARPALTALLGADLAPVAAERVPAGLGPGELWTAEAALARTIDRDSHRLLRSGRYGPEPVLGAIAVLAVDAWRVRAALAAAGSGSGAGAAEVLDVRG